MVVRGLLDSGELLLRRPTAELTRKGVGICHLCSNDRVHTVRCALGSLWLLFRVSARWFDRGIARARARASTFVTFARGFLRASARFSRMIIAEKVDYDDYIRHNRARARARITDNPPRWRVKVYLWSLMQSDINNEESAIISLIKSQKLFLVFSNYAGNTARI